MRSATKLALMAGIAIHTTQGADDGIPEIDRTRPLVPMASYTPPNDLNNVPGLHYPENYRILDCWECFEAQGKICIDAGHNSLYHHTRSSNSGNAFCCKPDSKEGYCNTGNTHDHKGVENGVTSVCSQPSMGASSNFQNILTGNRNHQMFAFCPTINHQKCGIQTDTGLSTDMGLKAGLAKKHVQSNDMKYKKPTSQDQSREYDACYYEITLDESVLDEYNPKKIHFQLSRKQQMNVYIYGGKSRLEATESVIPGNGQAAVGQTYTVGVDKGLLIVAYPNENQQDTEFGFNYWLEASLKPAPGEKPDSGSITDGNGKVNTGGSSTNTPTEIISDYGLVQETKNNVNSNLQTGVNPTPATDSQNEIDDTLFYALVAGAGVLFLAIVFICFKCKNKGKIQHNLEATEYQNNHTGENEKSMQLEDIDDENNNSNRPSLGKANLFENDSEKMNAKATYKQVNAASVMSGREEDGKEGHNF